MSIERRARLEALALRARQEMERTQGFGRVWLPVPELGDGLDYNVVICGAGMSGLTIAFGLARRGVQGVVLVDQRGPGAEGPWTHCARMKTLRSPKELAGTDFGVPSLTPRAWFETVYGEAAWAALDKFAREDWAAYLDWYRVVTAAEIHNGCRLIGTYPDEAGLRLELEGGGLPRSIRCRRLIVATGIEGSGCRRVPEVVRNLPKSLWTHSAEGPPGPSFSGRDFIVLGAAASAFDWAVAALEGGARRVDMIGRSAEFARTEVLDWMNFAGFMNHFAELSDAERWRFAQLYFDLKQPPTQDQFDRALAHTNFHMSLGRSICSVSEARGRVCVEMDTGAMNVDHLLVGTGYQIDLSAREELQGIAPRIVYWRDRRPASIDASSGEIEPHPYLGPGFELTPIDPAPDAWISRIHLFNNAAVPSLGPVSNGLTGLKYGAPRIVDALCGALFRENAARFAHELALYRRPHFDPRGYGRGKAETLT